LASVNSDFNKAFLSYEVQTLSELHGGLSYYVDLPDMSSAAVLTAVRKVIDEVAAIGQKFNRIISLMLLKGTVAPRQLLLHVKYPLLRLERQWP
jgi:hypothetical protein